MFVFFYTFQFQRNNTRFERLWRMKISVRESLQDWLLASGLACKSAETCANACSEMVENCIKYSSPSSLVKVNLWGKGDSILVETSNQAEARHRQDLKASISALDKASDLSQLFVQRLTDSKEGVSHLGLIKITLETKGKLELLPARHHHNVRIRLSMKIERGENS